MSQISVHMPAHRPAPVSRLISIDGEDEDLLPLPIDPDEDLETLSMYIHMAELARDE